MIKAAQLKMLIESSKFFAQQMKTIIIKFAKESFLREASIYSVSTVADPCEYELRPGRKAFTKIFHMLKNRSSFTGESNFDL